MKSILIVDDSLDDRDVLMSFLTHEGYLCDEASNGKEALEKIKVKKYDCIISDYQMSEGDGPWLIAQLDVLEFKPKFILVSSDAIEAAEILFNDGKIDYFLPKPINFNFLKLKL